MWKTYRKGDLRQGREVLRLPGGSVVKNVPANTGDLDWIPG